MDVRSAFLYGKIDDEVYVSQPLGFIDPKFLKKVYKVVKALYGLHQAPRAWYATLSTFLVNQIEDGIFISQDKYVVGILKKFYFMSVKTTSTPIETKKPLVKDAEAADVDVHLYRSMIGSLMYLTAFRLDIMYLKSQPKLGIWYPRESAFDLEAYSDSDYARANLNRKSTIGEAEYVAAANCCGQKIQRSPGSGPDGPRYITGPPGDEFHLGFKWSFVKSRGDLLEDDIENLKRSDEFRSEDVIEMKKNDVHI
nr:hypothetical protein [Tanacetum cinerariifolium]